MRKGLTEVVFILDRSGSMSGLESDTIGGFNSMIKKQKKENGEALISTVLFDDNTEVLHDRVDLKKRYGWEFLFLGANIDAIEVAGRFGIQASRAVNYECDSAGTELNYKVLNETVSRMRSCESVAKMSMMFDGEDCLAEIREDYNRRIKNNLIIIH